MRAVSCDQFYSVVIETESKSAKTFQESVQKISALSGTWEFDEVSQEFSKNISKNSALALKARLQSIRSDIQEQLQHQLEPLFAEDDLVLNAAKLWDHLSVHIQAVFTDLNDAFYKDAGELHLQSECEPFTAILTRSIAATLTKSFSESKIKRLVKLKYSLFLRYSDQFCFIDSFAHLNTTMRADLVFGLLRMMLMVDSILLKIRYVCLFSFSNFLTMCLGLPAA